MPTVQRSSEPIDRFRRMPFAGNGLTSVLASTVVIDGQGIAWGQSRG
jgi:hypothetical protein